MRRQLERGGRSSPGTLAHALQAQKSAAGSYSDCDNWSTFVRRRWAVDRNWHLGAVQSKTYFDFGESVWRFKVDTSCGIIVGSDKTGTLQAIVAENGSVAWQVDHVAPWTHIEMSQGYLVHHHTDSSFKVRTLRKGRPPSFVHYRYITTQNWAFCLKLRFPSLATGTYTQNNELQIEVYNVHSGELEQTFPSPDISDLVRIPLSLLRSKIALIGIHRTVSGHWCAR
jgi:hypothetical protein